MPALVGLVAMVGALAVVRLLTLFTDVSVFSVNVISLLGHRPGHRLRALRGQPLPRGARRPAAGRPGGPGDRRPRTMATAGRTVLFSGLTVAAALSSLLIFPQAFLRSMGYGGIAAVLVAMLAALTVLPATLRLLGRRVDAGRLPWRRHRAVSGRDDHGRWARLARGVMRRPVAGDRRRPSPRSWSLASPFLGATWGSVDYRVLPHDAASHVAADKLTQDFGAETSSANLLLRGASRPDVAAYTREVEQVDGIRRRTPGGPAGRRHAAAGHLGGQQPDRAVPGRRHGPARDRPAGTAPRWSAARRRTPST